MRLHVYIDGFNLYYGCFKNSKYKWLNINKLSCLLFPNHEISKIKYFTALVKIRENDSDYDKPNRQQVYLRALKTLPNVEIIKGTFLTHSILMKNAEEKGYTKVIKTEEKGTDVNIASHLINDGYKGLYDMAIVISNDSDLVEPIKIVIEELNLPVVVISPYEKNTIELKKIASFVKKIREGVLKESQFAGIISDSVGDIVLPESWR
ncbi:MAG: NYN domain-containing protein [Candidatus Nomurabacteria bacterium]|nr:NYN domain-containing protein [Candidatus Nomurabacteria bacterium]